jgi:hypothetical protein
MIRPLAKGMRMPKRWLLSVALAIVLAHPAFAEKLTSSEARFSLDVPDAPRVSYVWNDPSGDRSWALTYNGEAKPTIARADREKRYDAAVKTVVDRAKGMIRTQRNLERGEFAGREVVVQVPKGNAFVMTRQQFFLTDTRFYHLIYTGPAGTETSPEVEAFFNSFQITR